jgi:CRP-like cAMP-binding protein
VGEFGLIDGQPRSASVISAEPSQVLFLPAKAFAVIMQTRPSVAIGVRKKLGEIVRKRTGRNIPYMEGHIPDIAELQELSKILRDYNTQVLSTL